MVGKTLYVELAGVQTPPADEVVVDYETHRMVGKTLYVVNPPYGGVNPLCRKPTVWWGYTPCRMHHIRRCSPDGMIREKNGSDKPGVPPALRAGQPLLQSESHLTLCWWDSTSLTFQLKHQNPSIAARSLVTSFAWFVLFIWKSLLLEIFPVIKSAETPHSKLFLRLVLSQSDQWFLL